MIAVVMPVPYSSVLALEIKKRKKGTEKRKKRRKRGQVHFLVLIPLVPKLHLGTRVSAKLCFGLSGGSGSVRACHLGRAILKGWPSYSPGLRGTSYPGSTVKRINPERVGAKGVKWE
jgi:hypothetical protein